MSAHKGYRIIKRKMKYGISFTVQIREGNRYARSKTFSTRRYGTVSETERHAKAWGSEQASRIIAGLQQVNNGRVVTADALDLYIDFKRDAGLDEQNLTDTERRLKDLPRYCPMLSEASAPRQIYDWWKDWCERTTPSGRPKSASTKNHALGDCRTFLRWCYRARSLTGLHEEVLTDWIQTFRKEQRVKPQFTIKELKKGFKATITSREGVTTQHPFVIRWALYVYLGLRLREALLLRWSDFSGGHVLVAGKGRKERLVPIQDELQPYLDAYRKENDYDGYLFPDYIRSGDRSNSVKMFDAFLRKCKIEKKGRSTHSLRHCYAGLMTATGEPTALLQAYMGHSQSDMTRHYSEMAARYRADVEGWKRGEIRLK